MLLARVRLRRAHVLCLVGRYDDALVDLRLAIVSARRNGDRLWEARILHNRTIAHLALGSLRRADNDARSAGLLFEAIGQAQEAVQTSQNRAVVATQRGDVPAALRLLDDAERRYQSLGTIPPELWIDRGHAMLAAGLAEEAVANSEAALQSGEIAAVKQAEMALFCARAAIAADDPVRAREWARQAQARFRTQRRPRWQARAQLAEYQARYLAGERNLRLTRGAIDIAARADDLPDEERPLAYLLAAQLLTERGDSGAVAENLTNAARYRRRGSALMRASGWLAAATQAATQQRPDTVLRSCRHGLDALDEHRLLFGAGEIRALATTHSRDLARLALETVIERGSARTLLQWSERLRATSLAEPSVRPADDRETERELAAVRDSGRRMEDAEDDDRARSLARQQRDAGEAAVRRRRRQLLGTTELGTRFDVAALRAQLGDTQLVSLIDVSGTLHAVLVDNGRLHRYEIGPMSSVHKEADFVRFALRRTAYAQGRPRPIAADRLEHAVLGLLAERLDRAVVIVPPASLHSLPWTALPTLAGLPVSVAPSASMWMRAAAARPGQDSTVLLATGPGLESRGVEVTELAAMHIGSTVLGVDAGAVAATVGAALAAMNGAWIAHLAAHGTFRADSPLFSSLRLDDGALFVHDLDRLRSAPRIVILSACDTGVAQAVGADELLGLVAGLLRVGTQGVLASVVPVNDDAAISFMRALHGALIDGRSLAEAALAGRLNATGDPLAQATAASFTVWGA
jgi:hypothetical protein